jgi:hypothetical protein
MRDTEPAADGLKGADAPRPTDEATPGVELPPELEFEPVPRKVRRLDSGAAAPVHQASGGKRIVD